MNALLKKMEDNFDSFMEKFDKIPDSEIVAELDSLGLLVEESISDSELTRIFCPSTSSNQFHIKNTDSNSEMQTIEINDVMLLCA